MELTTPQAIVFDINGVLIANDKQEGLRQFLREKAATDARINTEWQGDVIALLSGLLYKHCPLCDFKVCSVVAPTAGTPHIYKALQAGEVTFEGVKVATTRMLTHHVHCPPAAQITLDYVTEFTTQPALFTRGAQVIESGAKLLRHAHTTFGAHNIYFLSNMSSEVFTLYSNRFSDLFELVPESNVLLSGQTGKQKPHKEAFEQMTRKYNVLLKHCLFFDDKQENVSAAREAGMMGVEFLR